MIGGAGSFLGPLFGTAIYQIIEELVQRFTDRVELVVGVILILVIMFAPKGFMGLVNIVKQKYLPAKTKTTIPASASSNDKELEKAS
jgi:branched-chain amino acid transport system permease protein